MTHDTGRPCSYQGRPARPSSRTDLGARMPETTDLQPEKQAQR